MTIPATGAAPVPFPVDSTTRPCCSGIGGHTQMCATLDVSLRLDTAANLIELARGDANTALRAVPADAPLFAVVDLVAALGHLRQAARLIDRAGVAIDRSSEAVTR